MTLTTWLPINCLRGGLVALAALLLLAACAGPPEGGPGSRAAPAGIGAYEAVGVASWYGGRFHGRQTASGETYDMYALTAAHRSLPFGTRVRVTNLDNGRSVVLRINDRGPFVKRRIIDVSRRAAEDLGFIRDGLTRVRVEVI
jgi:rare lipoprotein A